MRLSGAYDAAFDALLAAVSEEHLVEPHELAVFWPMIGHGYDRELMVVGRAVNGWIDRTDARELRDLEVRQQLLATVRHTSEGEGSDPMGWVTGAWGRRGAYSTARSTFWRFIRAVLAAVDPESAEDGSWSGRLAWTNLAKLAPWGGGNPRGHLLDVQRRLGPELLAREVAELDPRKVLVLTGGWWFEPFAQQLGLDVDWRDGLVEGVADDGSRRWVIAPHPQGKRRALLPEAVEAFRAGSRSQEA